MELEQHEMVEMVHFFRGESKSLIRDSKTYFGGDTTKEALERNRARQARNVRESAKYERWAKAIEREI